MESPWDALKCKPYAGELQESDWKYVDWDTVVTVLTSPEKYAPFCSIDTLRPRIMSDLLRVVRPSVDHCLVTPDKRNPPLSSPSPLSVGSTNVSTGSMSCSMQSDDDLDDTRTSSTDFNPDEFSQVDEDSFDPAYYSDGCCLPTREGVDLDYRGQP